MGFADQRVEIHPAHIVFRQNDHMVGRHLFDDLRVGFSRLLQLGETFYPFLRKHFQKRQIHLGGASRIVHRPVMVLQREVQRLCHRIQGMFRLPRQKEPGDAHRIQIGKLFDQPQPPSILLDKTHVKSGIVGR